MSEQPRNPKSTLHWFCVADLIFLVAVIGIIQKAKGSMLDDPGLGWHLRNVDAMYQQHSWLTEDLFSGPRHGAKCFANQWLGDLVLWLGDQWGSLQGIAAVTTLVFAFLARRMYRMLELDGLPIPLAAFWVYLAVLGTSISFVARPNMFSILFVMVTGRMCEGFHRGIYSKRQTWILAPLFILWANIHSSFLAGMVLVTSSAAVELGVAAFTRETADRKKSIERFLHWCVLVPALFACTLVNPYGWKLILWIQSLLSDDYFMKLNSEWQSPDFNQLGARRYEIVILLFPLIMLATRRINWVALMHSMLFFHLALSGKRYVPLWIVLVVPMLARACMDSLLFDWLGQWFPGLCRILGLRAANDAELAPAPQNSSFQFEHVAQVRSSAANSDRKPWFASLVIALALLGWARQQHDFAFIKQEHIPTETLDKLLAIHREGEVVFHHYNWGGYLTWHGWPKLQTWIDDRNDVQGKEHTREFFEMLNYFPGTISKLNAANVKYVCIPPVFPLATRLQELSAEWEVMDRGEFAILFRRREAK